MKLKFKFWNEWKEGIFNLSDGRFTLFAFSWTRDIDFWGFKIIIFNFVFSWFWKGYEEEK